MSHQILLGDCRDRLKELSDNSIDSIVTDPPYELAFMGKSWDASGVAYDVTVWQECLRVLKPGGHLLSFGGSRTYHRMACAIEDAGFQIRDQIMWVYGSGFPKSHNISIGIDKKAGVMANRGVRVSVAGNRNQGGENIPNASGIKAHEPITAEAKEWDGWGTALKPAHEPIVLARKPLVGTVANNVLTYGVGGINIDGCRVESFDSSETARKPSFVGDTSTPFGVGVEMGGNGSPLGRFPANFIHDGSNEVLELFPDSKSGGKNVSDVANANGLYRLGFGGQVQSDMAASSGSAARFFYCAKASKKDRNEGLDGFADKEVHRYGAGIGEGLTPNAPANDKNHHPTVKPTDLMRYLCRLVTPPNGTVLDPFTGSGSTGKAAVLEGFSFIGVEQSEEYIAIAEARIQSAKEDK